MLQCAMLKVLLRYTVVAEWLLGRSGWLPGCC